MTVKDDRTVLPAPVLSPAAVEGGWGKKGEGRNKAIIGGWGGEVLQCQGQVCVHSLLATMPS
jgi:hypothetical protein